MFKGKHPVSSLDAWILLKLHAWLRNTNVGGDLRCVKFETMVLPNPVGVQTGMVDPSLLKPLNEVRRAVDKLLDSTLSSSTSGALDSVQKVLFRSRGVWYGNDPHFVIEVLMLVGLFGTPGTEFMKKETLSSFPTVPGGFEEDEVLRRLTAIKEAKWYQYLEVGAKSLFATVFDFATALAGKECPKDVSFLNTTPFFHANQRGYAQPDTRHDR